ncbi:uncharacterized protein LOC133391265 [Anopheles gambiae]|uniref:uncharacterized protein LOC133391265 n=1 Tax=Anopheles gambiae TaxID=7165 RepID=UPI002AC8CAB6|nr:uncharacterized protein LOC133391265 [Anopheles gambiae]
MIDHLKLSQFSLLRLIIIVWTKANIVNEKILSDLEMNLLEKTLQSENIPFTTKAEALTFIETSIATNNREIVLLLKTPKLDPRIFRKVKIYPVLYHQGRIHLDHTSYVINGNISYMVNSLNQYVYSMSEVNQDRSECVPRLIGGQQASCNFTKQPRTFEAFRVGDQAVLINSIQNFSLFNNCGTSNRTLKESFVVRTNSCDVWINDVQFSSKVVEMIGELSLYQLDGIVINKQHEVINISIEHLLDLHLETRKELEHIRLENQSLSITWPSISLLGGTSIPLVICIVILLVCRRKAIARVDLTIAPAKLPTQRFHTVAMFRGRQQHTGFT